MFKARVFINHLHFGANSKRLNRCVSNFPHMEIAEEVRDALVRRLPIIALESTIITHGMPYPRNVECALEVEEQVRKKGAVPATIGILEGRIKVGLTKREVSYLGDIKNNKVVKTSRRDFAYVIANKLSGGTTVSGTLIVAGKVGIPVFATGGLGGVHRMGEKSFDISADLIELGKTPVAVVSSGIKSILDIPKTLEYLETQGVFVATFGETNDFPAFYSRKSGCRTPYNVTNAVEVARLIKTNTELDTKSGMLFGVPVPTDYAMSEEEMDEIIKGALELARKREISGKDITPFLLAFVAEATSGRSLQTNIALVKNNASVAADIAVELSRLWNNGSPPTRKIRATLNNRKTPVVIGGSVMDRCVTLAEADIKLDGRTHDAKFTNSSGGVARNITDALGKLNCDPVFISAVGDDNAGYLLCSQLSHTNTQNVYKSADVSTAQCIVVMDADGECRFLFGDMDAHKLITPEMIKEREDLIRDAPLVVLDANPTCEAMEAVLEIASRHNVPVFFEPTDVLISKKPFKTRYWKAIKFISPNVTELKYIAEALGITIPLRTNNVIEDATRIAELVGNYIQNVIVTLGKHGILIARRANAREPMLQSINEGHVQIRHYPSSKVKNIVNVSGAGDCLVSGFISAMLENSSEEICVSVGMNAAYASLGCSSAVPTQFCNSFHTPAFYNVL